jgi:16S rRNA (uracil1498-N3)-methyltransferase
MDHDDDSDHRTSLRLWIAGDLAAASPVRLDSDQAHYLRAVMRRSVGDEILVFNGRDGEWLGRLVVLSKSGAQVEPLRQTRPQTTSIDLRLVFAPIKRARLEILIEKAVELGVSALVPVITRRTIVSRLNLDRLSAHAREAAEQTERLDVPAVEAPRPLEAVLSDWDHACKLLFCDETGGQPSLGSVLQGAEPCQESWAVLIGPEGGFEPGELDLLRGFPFATAVSLGPRVLRADTAAVAALAVFQALRGDWETSRGEATPAPPSSVAKYQKVT